MNAVVRAARREVSAAIRRAVSAADIGGLSDQEIIDLIRGSELPEQLAGAARAAKTERRVELVDTKKREIAAAERDGAMLRKDYETAEATVAGKRAELNAAQRALDAAHGAFVARDIRHRHAVAAIDAELQLLAPKPIADFIERMNAEWERLRAGSFELVGANLGGEDAAARNAAKSLRMDGLTAAIAAANALKLTALDGEALLAKLKDIEANMLDMARAERVARGQ